MGKIKTTDNGKIKWQIKNLPLALLKPNEKNPRRLTEKGMTDLDKSIDKFGLAEPIVINTDGIIIGYSKDTLGRKVKSYLKKCNYCNSYFKLKSNLLIKRKFCSHKCAGLVNGHINGSQKREVVIQRNKEDWFKIKVSNGVKEYHKKNPVKKQKWFIDIYGENHKPKSDYHIPGAEWRKRQRIINAKNVCQRCGIKDKLNVHHIIPYSISRDNSPRNLIVLCKSCHRIVEANNIRIYNMLNDWNVLRALYKNHLLDNGRLWDATT